MHLTKTWIKTKLSGDRASYRIRGAQYKMKARGPCTESRGWNFYPPFVVFSTIYQGGFFFLSFFFKPLFLFAILWCDLRKQGHSDTRADTHRAQGPCPRLGAHLRPTGCWVSSPTGCRTDRSFQKSRQTSLFPKGWHPNPRRMDDSESTATSTPRCTRHLDRGK